MNLIHTKCRIRKSLKTHLNTVTSFCSHLVQQLLGFEAVELLELVEDAAAAPAAEGRLIPPSAVMPAVASSLSLVAPVALVATLPLAIILSQQTLPNLELSSWILELSSTVDLFFMPPLSY